MTTASTLRERERQRKASWRSRNPGMLYSDDRPFVGVDGEGGNVTGAAHDYFLLRAGERSVYRTDRALSTEECLEFLSSLDPDPIYITFFFDYDVTKICRDLSMGKIRELLEREKRVHPRVRAKGGRFARAAMPFPVNVCDDRFQIDYLPGKEFRVRRRNPNGKWGFWVVFNDTGSFFQCAFVRALELWDIGTPEQRAAIAAGKEDRSRFDISRLPDIDKYNHLECRLLAELLTDFRSTCKRTGYVPRKWQGPGQIAEAMLRARGIPPSREIPVLSDPVYAGLVEFANAAFYGGRPEITCLGPVAPVWQTDINSAYPHALLHVPCLLHGTWEYRKAKPDELAISYGHFKPKGKRPTLYGLPVRRKDGTIYYPGEGSGWWWSFEIHASRHQSFRVENSWVYIPHCNCVPFWFIPDIYAMRLRVGKDTLGLVLKLILNSLYGKMAQSVGSPKFSNPIWASFITAFCRTQVQGIIHGLPGCQTGKCGSDVVMVATDAVFTTVPPGVDDSRTLGGYSVERLEGGIHLVQPGLYFREGTTPKTRGVPRKLVEERRSEFSRAFLSMTSGNGLNTIGDLTEPVPWGTVEIPMTSFVGLRLGLHRGKRELIGEWIDNPKKISYDCTSKRMPGLLPFFPGAAIQTYPYPGGPEVVTVPYSKEIGKLNDLMRLEAAVGPAYDQPDWSAILGEME